MTEYPTLAAPYPSKKVISTFRGYNHNLKIGDGEFYDMENLTGDAHPLLSVRRPRGKVPDFVAAEIARADRAQQAWEQRSAGLAEQAL